MSNYFTKLILSLFILVVSIVSAVAQINPINPWQTIPEDLNVCADSSQLEVRLVVFDNDADNGEVTITFPPGTFYVPGSIEIEPAFTNNGLSLVESDLSDPNSPIFSITPADLTLEDSLAFRITRYADCGYIGYTGAIVDEISISHSGGGVNPVVVNSLGYNTNSGLLTPQYSTLGRDTLITVTGLPSQEVCRAFTVTQGDVGIIRNPIVHQIELGPDILNYNLSFEGGVVTPDSTVGQFVYYTIDLSQAPYIGNVGNGDDLFENGEVVVFEECFQVDGCSQASNAISHILSWGCLGETCQVTDEYTGSVAVQGVAPSLSVVRTLIDLPTCLDGTDQGQFQYEATNTSGNDALYQFRLNVRTNSDVSSWVQEDSYFVIDGDTTYLDDPSLDITIVPITGSGVSCGSNIQQMIFRDILIPAGSTAQINGFYFNCCLESCNGQRIADLFDLVYWGLNACSGNYSIIGSNRYVPFGGNKSANEPLVSGDAFMADGETSSFCAEYPGYSLMTLIQDPTIAYVDYSIGLPTGMMFVPGSFDLEFGVPSGTTATGVPSSTFMNATMDTVTLRYPVGQFLQAGIERLFSFCYEASLDCSNPGASDDVQNITYSWEHNPNPSCSTACVIPMRCDDTFTLFLGGCQGPCPLGGGIITNTGAERINTYLADPANTRQYDPAATPADPADVRVDRMSPGDTMCIVSEGRAIDGSANAVDPFTYGEIRHNLSWGSVMDALPAEGTIVLSGVSYAFSGLVPSFVPSGTEAGSFIYDVSPASLNLLNPAIPAGVSIIGGDSISIQTCYRFDTDPRWIDQTGSSLNGNLEDILDNFTTTNFYLSTVNDPELYACGTAASTITLVSVGTLFTSTGSTSNPASLVELSCTEQNVHSRYFYNYRGRLLAARDFDFYPNEFRPIMRLDTYYLDKEVGFDLVRFRHITYTRNAAGSNVIIQDIASLPYTDLGDRFMILYEDLWEDVGGPLNYYEDNVWFRIMPYYTTNCEFDEDRLVVFNDSWTFNNPENNGQQISEGSTHTRWYGALGEFSYIQAPFIVNATSVENEILLLATNEDNRNVDFTWIQVVPNPDADLTGVSIGGVEMVYNPAGFWETGSHAANATRTLEFSVNLGACATTEFEVIYGWNCMGYPDAVDASACSFDTIPYVVQPVEAQISLNIRDQPDAPLDLCDPYTVAIDYASVLQADLINPGVEIVALPGLTLSEVRGTYIGNTGAEEVMPISVLPNGNWYIDFTDHTAVTGDSLPGVVTTAMPNPRLFQLEADFLTDCDFNPGQRMRFIGRGISPCGNPARRAGQTTFSSPIRINGANPYEVGFNVIVDQNEFPINGCGGGSATLNVEALILGGSTTDADTIITELPAGIEYVEGSYICTSADPANCPTFSDYEIQPDGSSTVKLSIPENIASFQQMDFRFEIATTFVEACTDSLPYSIRNLLTIDNLECMGATCPDPIVSILGEFLGGFEVDKIEPNVQNATACEDVSGTYNLVGDVEMVGFGLGVDEELVLSVYCESNPNESLGSTTIVGPVDSGMVAMFDFTVPALCGDDSNLILRFDEMENCVCETIESLVPITNVQTNISQLSACPIEIDGITGEFTLTDADIQVDTSGMFTVTYHDSYTDAVSGIDALSSPYISETITLWTRVVDTTGCAGVDILQLVVNDNPVILLDGTDQICADGEGMISVELLSALEPVSYLWSNGETTDAITGLDIGIYSVTVTDSLGCIRIEEFEIGEFSDLSFVNCPLDFTVQFDNSCTEGPINWAEPLATTSCVAVPVTQTEGPMNGSVIAEGTYTITYEATVDGVTVECSFDLTVEAAAGSFGILCHKDMEMPTDEGMCSWESAEWEVIPLSVQETCDGCDLSYEVSFADGTVANGVDSIGVLTFPIGTNTVCYTIDCDGQLDSCCFDIIVVDETAPMLECGPDVTLSTDADVCAASSVVTATVTDNCFVESLTYTVDNPDGSLVSDTITAMYSFAVGFSTVTVTAVDSVGNLSSCVYQVLVEDNEDPTIDCSAIDGDVLADAGACSFTMPGAGFDPIVTDNCIDEVLTHDYVLAPSSNTLAGAEFPVGSTDVTWTVTDGSGNTASCMITVTVTDDEAPVFVNCPEEDIIVGNDVDNCDGAANWAIPVATDNCGIAMLEQTEGPAPGSILPLGDTQITYVATDAAGNAATCTFTITVVDTQDPLLVCPKDMVMSADEGECSWTSGEGELNVTLAVENCPATLNYTVSNDAGTIATGTGNVPAGTVLTEGDNEVCYTLTDENDVEIASCCFIVTVEDTEAPVLAGCSTGGSLFGVGNQIFSSNAGLCSAALVGSFAATDNCELALEGFIVFTRPDGSLYEDTITLDGGNYVLEENDYEVGQWTYEGTIFDLSGNATSCTGQFLIEDNEVPSIACATLDATYSTDSGSCDYTVDGAEFDPVVGDNCAVSSVTNDYNATSSLANEVFPVGDTDVIWTVTDESGNESTCEITVTVTDDEAPVFVDCPPAGVTVDVFTNDCTTDIFWDIPTATDNCEVTVVQTGGPEYGSAQGPGLYMIEYTATDEAGNTAICSFEIEVIDTENPVILNCPFEDLVLEVGDDCLGQLPDFTMRINGEENCGPFTVTQTPEPTAVSGITYNVGDVVNVMITLEDASGNSSTCEFDVLVEDNTAPTVICNDIGGGLGAGISFVEDFSDNSAGWLLGPEWEIGTATNNGGCNFWCPLNPNTDNTSTADNGVAGVTLSGGCDGDNGLHGFYWLTSPVIDASNVAGTLMLEYYRWLSSDYLPYRRNHVEIFDGTSWVLIQDLTNPSGIPVCDDAWVFNAIDISAYANANLQVRFGWSVESGGYIPGDSWNIDDFTIYSENTMPEPLYLDADGLASIEVADIDGGSFDNCEIAEISLDITDFNCTQIGSNTVTMTVTDVNGNVSTCQSEVVVVDTLAPEVMCVEGLDLTLNAQGNATINVADIDNGTTDNCSIASLSIDQTFFDCSNVGSNTVVLTATDSYGNVSTCSTTVNVTDDQSPEFINCPPADAAVQVFTNDCVTDILWDIPVAIDNCEVTTVQTAGPAYGSPQGPGIYTIEYTATDASGNTDICTFNIEVIDTENPVILNCPFDDRILEVGADCIGQLPDYTMRINGEENCGPFTVTQTPEPTAVSGITYNVGDVVNVMITLEDGSGNSSTCEFDVLVEDNTAPTVICNDIGGGLGAGISFVEDFSDNSAGWLLGPEWEIGTATNNGGCNNWCPLNPNTDNTSTADNGVAGVTLSGGCDGVNGLHGFYWLTSPVIDASNVAGTLMLEYYRWLSSDYLPFRRNHVEIFNGTTWVLLQDLSDYNFNAVCDDAWVFNAIDISAYANANLQVRFGWSVESGGYIPGDSWNIDDFTIYSDNTAPEPLYLDADGLASISVEDIDGGSFDNCGIADISLDITDFNCTQIGSNTVTMTVTDVNGNVSTCQSEVVVVDTLAPEVMCVEGLDLTLNAQGNATINVADIDNGTTDNCSIASLSIDQTFFDCSNVGSNTVVLTAIDSYGNVSTCATTVNVTDDQSPEFINCPPAGVMVDVFTSDCVADILWDIPVAIDNCEVTTVQTAGPAYGSPQGPGIYTIEYTATDASGNTDICSFDIEVIDTENPVILNCPFDDRILEVGADCLGQLPDYTMRINGEENCGPFTVTQTPEPTAVSGITYNVGDVISVMVTLEDESGNSSTCEFDVLVEDNTLPTVICNDIGVGEGAGISFVEDFSDNSAGWLLGPEWEIGTVSNNGCNSWCPLNPTTDNTSTADNGVAGVTLSGGCDGDNGLHDFYWLTSPVIDASNVTGTLMLEYYRWLSSDYLPYRSNYVEIFDGSNWILLQDLSDYNFNAVCDDAWVFNAIEISAYANANLQVRFGWNVSSGGYIPGDSWNIDDFTIYSENTAPEPVYLDENGMASITVEDIDGGSFDNCGIADISLDITDFDCSDLGSNIVTMTVTDVNGNVASCQSEVIVVDTLSPVIICQEDVEIPTSNLGTTGDCEGQYSWEHPIPTDNCTITDYTVTYTNPDGTIDGPYVLIVGGAISTEANRNFGVGTTTVNYVVNDESFNVDSCSFAVTVVEDEAPIFLNCPRPPVVVDAPEGWCSSYVNFSLPLAITGCGFAEVTQTDDTGLTSGDLFPVGLTILEFTASDGSGNTTVCEIKIVVNDFHTPPVITCPEDLTVVNDLGNCGAVVTGIDAEVEDNCADNVAITYEIADEFGFVFDQGIESASGVDFPGGTSTLTYTAYDQPIILITEVEQTDAFSGIEIGNVGPAAMDLACAQITRIAGLDTIVYTIPNNTILNVGSVYTYSFDTLLMEGETASYAISFLDYEIDQIVINTGDLNGANIFRIDGVDNDDESDWNVANDCVGGSFGTYNPQMPVYTDNGTTTSLQAEAPSFASCTTNITVLDIEAPVCATQDTIPYVSSDIAIMDGMCITSVVSASGGVIGDININDFVATIDNAGAITASLTSPSGVSIELFSKLCEETADIDLTLDDDATSSVLAVSCSPLGNGNAYMPTEAFKTFYGEDAAGEWTLSIYSDVPVEGSLDNWTLEIITNEAYAQMDTAIFNDEGECAAEFTWTHPVFTDNCCEGTMDVTYEFTNSVTGATSTSTEPVLTTSGLVNLDGVEVSRVFEVGTTVVTYTLTDVSDNPTICGFTVTVEDNEAPTFPMGCQDITVSLDPGDCAITLDDIPAYEDNCGVDSIYFEQGGEQIEVNAIGIGVNEITLFVVDIYGNVGSCTFIVEVLEYNDPTSTLGCNNNLNISLDPNCEAVLTADMILEGGPYGCYDNYCIVVLNSDGVEVDNFFDLDDVGETFEVSIVDCNGTGNSCWGYVTIEEKLFPEIECPADIELTCNQDPDAVYPVGHPLAGTLVTGEAQMLTCEVNGVISYVDELIDYGTCEDPRVELTRIWTLNDGDGNSVSCNQLITFAPYNPLDVDFPADLDFENSLECTDVASNPELTNPSNTGVPTFGGESIIGSNYCDISIGYFDEFYQDVNCPSAYTILRYWKIENECLPIEIGVNPYTHVQRIKVRDIEAPEVLDLADVTISVDPWDCVASYTLPTGVFEDNCSDFEVSWSASYGQVIGNELTNILKGVTTVTAKVTDACGNFSYGSFEITAIDSSPPVVVAEATHTISLSTTGVAKLYAEDLDDGSFDGCGPVAFFAKRMDDGPNCSFDEYPPVGNDNAQFNEAVFFCCDDVSDEPIMVQFQVCDDANMDGIAGNEGDLCNLAMVEVYVQDKLAPVIVCPDNMSISCTDLAGLDLTDTDLLNSLFGEATAAGTCTVEISQVAVGNESCGAGVIFRNFTASNTAGTTSCQQIITVTAGPDEILTCSRISFADLNNSIYDWCLVNDNNNDNDDDLPALEIECGEALVIPEIDLDIDGLCTEAGLSTTVDTFQFAGGACQKYLIHYEVIDQCIFDDNFVDPVTGEIDPYHTDNGYFEFYLEVDAFDTEAPTPDCEDLTLTATSCTGLDGEITVGVTDNCTQDGFFGFQWRLDLGANNTIDFPSSGWYSSSSVSPAQVGLSEFPIGVHRIYWLISDGCGNDATCSQLITIVNEDKAPTPYCIDGLSVAVMPSTGTVALWANDFDAGSFDNCEGELLLSMIPEQDVANATAEEAYDLSFDHPNVTQQPNGDYGFNFDCSYIPNGISAVLEVRIYVTDANGNWDYCTANLRLDDNLDACEDDATGMLTISGEIYTEEGEDIEKVEVVLEAEYPEFPKYFTTLDNGLFAFYDLVGNIDYTVNPGRNDDFLNGVTTLDIVLIQKHILGIEVLESPYKLIAADVNSDCKVTGIDLVQLRKLILGKYEDDILPDNNSWRFVKEEFEFIDDQQPCVYDEVSEFVNLSEMAHQRFYGMKIGDINGSVEANFASISDTRSGESFELLINDREIASDLVTEVPVYVSESDVIYGFQTEIVLSDAELIDISSELLDLTESNIQRIADGLRISFDYASGLEVASDQRLFTLRLRSNSDLELSEVLMINQEGRFSSEVYVENLVIEEPVLRFNDDNGNTISEVFSIGQNEPNPFKDKTTIDYNLPATGTVNLRVSDISGKILYSSELTGKKGMNSITLTEEVINSTGVLYYEIEFNNQKLGKKMIKID